MLDVVEVVVTHELATGPHHHAAKLLCMVKRRRIAADTVYTLNGRGRPSRRAPLASSGFPVVFTYSPSLYSALRRSPRAATPVVGACGVMVAATAEAEQSEALQDSGKCLVMQLRPRCGSPERSIVGRALLHDPPSRRYPHRRSFDVEYRRPLTSQFTSRQLNDGEPGSHNNLRVLNGLQNIGPAG